MFQRKDNIHQSCARTLKKSHTVKEKIQISNFGKRGQDGIPRKEHYVLEKKRKEKSGHSLEVISNGKGHIKVAEHEPVSAIS